MKLSAFIITALGAVAASAQQLCTANQGSPKVEDCKAAINALPKPTGGPEPCLKIYASRWTLATKGTCQIVGYSSRGNAACLSRQAVIDAAIATYEKCTLRGEFTEGGTEIARDAAGDYEGVLIQKPVPE